MPLGSQCQQETQHPTGGLQGSHPGSATYCVDLGKLLNFSVPPFPLCKMQITQHSPRQVL